MAKELILGREDSGIAFADSVARLRTEDAAVLKLRDGLGGQVRLVEEAKAKVHTGFGEIAAN